ncbi:MAG TPA: 2-C-methyl-D-erythritol 4-phosphate cytidylyltransferase [Baekduia sp.]|nr:2-C-methyl-D-erythritol 4-phosphate cytidylyltransferase [Baekduia sp.]
MAVALLVAAGRGERLGSDGPKAFVALYGRPMWEWSLDVLRATCHDVVVALPEGVEAPEGCVGVRGGAQRSHSVRNALGASSGDPVLVHDAARPLVTPEIVRACLDGLAGADAAIAAARVVDTIKEGGPDVERTLDRSRLWAIQTPQVFRRAVLERALAQDDAVLAAATDDASLVEALGGRVRLVQTPRTNLKVTTPEDLVLAESLLAHAHGSARPPSP